MTNSVKTDLPTSFCRHGPLRRTLLALGGALLLGLHPAVGATFVNPTDISINLPGLPPGVTPYPSPITVSGLAGVITNVIVTFTNVTHSNPDNLDILLLGPGGQRVLLMSDAGDSNPINSVRLTFSDDATAVLPDTGRIITGAYRPTNYAPAETNFPAGTPAPPYATALSVFDGTDPNGPWRLFVHDDAGGANGTGIINGGWLLTLGVAVLPPVIVNQPKDQAVPLGGTAAFQVDVTGTPPFDYQWLRNGQVFVPFGQGSRSLVIENISASDIGVYSVVVRNAASPNGVRSDDARLVLLEPVVIVRQPEDQTVLPGGTATFQVVVSGTPPFRYQWLRNGQVIVQPGGGGATLTLANVQANQAGYYSVMVANDASPNGVQSIEAFLNVLGPLVVVEPPSSVVVQPGADVRLRVTAAGRPPLRYQWTLNGMVLPNQTGDTLKLPNVDAKSGGNYQVIVQNDTEAITTDPALVRVQVNTATPPSDEFDGRPTVQSPQGILQGDSSQARTEPGEPALRGGGRSVWFQWFTPESGIVTMGARGSSFDTLLAVYTGTKLDNLALVTKDDDRGGFYTSSVKFNVERGKMYQIQLDGFGLNGAGGPFTVCWELEPTNHLIPVILEEPASVGVRPRGTATFRVLTDTQNLEYQWFFNGNLIPGARDNVYTVVNARRADVGFYTVRIINEFQRVLFSESAELQLGSFTSPVSQDKLENVYFALANRSSGGGGFVAASGGSLGAGYMAIGLGNLVSNAFVSSTNRQPLDPNPCGGAFLGTKWQGLFATNTGPVQVNTVGSEIPSRLAIYHLTGGLSDLTVPPIVCDLTSASNGLPVVVQFDARQGSNYLIEVEGYQATGNIELNCLMGNAPPLTNPLRYCFVSAGGSFLLSMPATNWFPTPACQWRLNGIDMPGETGTTLLVNNFDAGKVGTYSVWMSNFVGTATRDVAYLALAGPFALSHRWTTNGVNVGFVLNASNSSPFVLESSTNLNGSWIPIATNPDPCLILLYTNLGALTDPQRFFRAAPWPPIGP